MVDKAKVVIVAALSKNGRALGNQNSLLWHIPDDLRRFKELTAHHPVIMGRKTFESIVALLGKPLPGRQNIVVTRNTEYVFDGVIVVQSLEDALRKAHELDTEEIHIGGGAEIYTQALPYVDELYLTFVEDEPIEADTFFPEFEDEFIAVHIHEPREYGELTYQWIDYIRNK